MPRFEKRNKKKDKRKKKKKSTTQGINIMINVGGGAPAKEVMRGLISQRELTTPTISSNPLNPGEAHERVMEKERLRSVKREREVKVERPDFRSVKREPEVKVERPYEQSDRQAYYIPSGRMFRQPFNGVPASASRVSEPPSTGHVSPVLPARNAPLTSERVDAVAPVQGGNIGRQTALSLLRNRFSPASTLFIPGQMHIDSRAQMEAIEENKEDDMAGEFKGGEEGDAVDGETLPGLERRGERVKRRPRRLIEEME